MDVEVLDLPFIDLEPLSAPAGAEFVIVDAEPVERVEDVCAFGVYLLVEQEKREVELGECPGIVITGRGGWVVAFGCAVVDIRDQAVW